MAPAADDGVVDRSVLPGGALVRSFRPVPNIGHDGAVSGLLLWYRSIDGAGQWLECDVDALRAGLAAAPNAPIVGFFPEGVDVADVANLFSAATEALTTASVAAPLAPVTDAVKRISGRRIVDGVDRSLLRRLQGPAFARTDVVQRAVRDLRGGTIMPLVAASQLRIGPLAPLDVAS